MRRLLAPVLAALALLAPAAVFAHPHMVVQQVVRMVAKDGKYTHVEIEWRFDPYSSEVEIPLIDEDKNGKFSPRETKLLESEMMPELGKYGYLSWLNTGAKDFRPPKAPQFSAPGRRRYRGEPQGTRAHGREILGDRRSHQPRLVAAFLQRSVRQHGRAAPGRQMPLHGAQSPLGLRR